MQTKQPQMIEKPMLPPQLFYLLGGLWLVLAVLLPLYDLRFLALAAVATVAVFFVLRRVLKPVAVLVPAPPKPVYSGELPLGEQGIAFLRELDERQEGIENEHVSAQIARIRALSESIFEQLAQKPALAGQLRRFVGYYLPTTLRILESYDQLESQTVKGENVRGTMQGVEKTLDMVIAAFEKQLDSLFADRRLDLETEMEVLGQILAQEGLAGGEMPAAFAATPQPAPDDTPPTPQLKL